MWGSYCWVSNTQRDQFSWKIVHQTATPVSFLTISTGVQQRPSVKKITKGVAFVCFTSRSQPNRRGNEVWAKADGVEKTPEASKSWQFLFCVGKPGKGLRMLKIFSINLFTKCFWVIAKIKWISRVTISFDLTPRLFYKPAVWKWDAASFSVYLTQNVTSLPLHSTAPLKVLRVRSLAQGHLRGSCW